MPETLIILNVKFSGLEKGECTEEDLQKAKSMVPKSLEKYVERKLFWFTA